MNAGVGDGSLTFNCGSNNVSYSLSGVNLRTITELSSSGHPISENMHYVSVIKILTCWYLVDCCSKTHTKISWKKLLTFLDTGKGIKGYESYEVCHFLFEKIMLSSSFSSAINDNNNSNDDGNISLTSTTTSRTITPLTALSPLSAASAVPSSFSPDGFKRKTAQEINSDDNSKKRKLSNQSPISSSISEPTVRYYYLSIYTVY